MRLRWALPGVVTMLTCASLASAASAAVTPITTQADGNTPGTLRYAITHASGTDTVVVPAGAYSLTLGPLFPPAGLNIAGAASGSTTIDGGGQRIMYSSGPLAVSGITFTHGSMSANSGNAGGGAIEIQGSGALTISNCAFIDNSASLSNIDYSGGGAIYVMGGASATISGSTFTGNTATADLLDYDGGGAIYVGGAGTLTLSGDNFSANSFRQTDAGTTGLDGGGATYSSGATTVSASRFTGDSSTIDTTSFVREAGGGALFSSGGTTVTSSTFSADTSTIADGEFTTGGGGLYNDGGPLSVDSSTFTADRAVVTLVGLVSNGGGALFNRGTSTTIVNSTLSGNSVSASAPGGNEAGGGALYDYSANGGTISSTTIDGNSVSFPGTNNYAYGGGIYEAGAAGTLALHNTILAENAVSGGEPSGGNCWAAGAGYTTITSAGHNIEDANTCGLTAPGDRPSTTPLLGSLQDNGGPAFTRALLPGSPAIDHGDNSGCPATDERGVARPQGPSCDIGAYEVGDADLAVSAVGSPNPIAVGGHLTYTAKVMNAGPTPTNATLHVVLPAGLGFVSASAGCIQNGTSVTCALGALAAQGSGQITIVVSLPRAGAVVSTFSVSSSDPDPTLANNSATVSGLALGTATVTGFKESAKKWHAGKKPKRGVGTTLSFTLNEPARVTLTFAQTEPGRKIGKRCVAQTRHNETKHRCSRSQSRGSVTVTGRAGANKVHFLGRTSRSKQLKPGHYTVTITAVAALGRRSRAHSLKFTIVR